MRGPAAMVTVPLMRTAAAAFKLLENTGTTFPAFMMRASRSPNPKVALGARRSWPGTGSILIACVLLIALMAVFSTLRKTLGLKVLPPSVLVRNELVMRTSAAS